MYVLTCPVRLNSIGRYFYPEGVDATVFLQTISLGVLDESTLRRLDYFILD